MKPRTLHYVDLWCDLCVEIPIENSLVVIHDVIKISAQKIRLPSFELAKCAIAIALVAI